MSSIFGMFNKRGEAVQLINIEKAMKALNYWKSDASNIWIKNDIAFGCHLLYTTPQSTIEKLPYWHEESGCCITADARVDYREELAERLNIAWDNAKNLPDSQLILKAYLKWGQECVKILYGDFAFAIWDSRSKELFCARDHFGCRPFYYVDANDYFSFASDIKGLYELPGVSLQIDEQFIVDRLTSIVLDKNKTAYLNLFRLKPSHCITLKQSITPHISRYWELKIKNEIANLDEEEAKCGIKSLFISSVHNRCRSMFPIGIELSGGLDSSAIACTASNLSNKNISIFAFTHALSDEQKKNYYPFKDESKYSRQIAEVCNFKNHYHITGENDVGSQEVIIEYLELASGTIRQGFAMFSDALYNQANSAGVKVLLSGFGGDEGVTSQASGFFEELVHREDFDLLKVQLRIKIKENGGNYYRSLIRLFSVKWVPWIFEVRKLLHFNNDFRRSAFKTFAIDKGIKRKYKIKRRYYSKVSFPDDNDVRKRQYKRILHDHISERLEESFLCVQKRRIEYRYPFLDVKLIEFYFSLPSEFKYRNGFGRYIFRQAMEGILPDEICWRKDKTGTTIPNIQYRFMKDEKEFREIIEEGRKENKYHYLDYDKLHWMADQILERNKGAIIGFGPSSFFRAISVLILQKWQREGKIDIGIRC